ncbi:MAG TPA: hypothetical protein VGO66_00845 [Solirubrobacterales bacterium]|nr:hypothetical protein [Solirubrobacterales bacterium]
MRKLALLASMALIALAFALPASASAYTEWTYNGAPLEEGEVASQSFEGKFSWWILQLGKYSCDVSVEIEAEGFTGGWVSSFLQDAESCSGTLFWGGCQLVAYPNSLGGAKVDVASSPPKVSNPGEKVEILDVFEGCQAPWRTMKVPYFDMVTTLDEEGRIASITLQSYDQFGLPVVIGPLTPAESPELGLQ